MTDPAYNENELLHQIANGETNAFAKVFEHHRARVFFIAWKFLKSETAAEDALQEVFLSVWTQREKLTDIENFRAYLNTVTRNHLYNRLRKKFNEEKFLRENLVIQQTSPDQIPDEILWRQLEEELKGVVQQLSPKQREAFQLSRFEGLKHEEIANGMGISKETVKKHVMEAVRHIRDHFRKLGFDKQLLLIFLMIFRFFLTETTPLFWFGCLY